MIVVTASYGRGRAYDEPKRPPPGVSAAYAFTDDPRWYEAGWLPGPSRNNATISPRYRGKGPKCAPHHYFDDLDVLWIDASMQSTGSDIRALLDVVPRGGVGCFRHRFRTCIYQEAEASLAPGFTRYVDEPIREQVAHYRARGFPENAGLWEMGCIFWRGMQFRLGDEWMSEQLAWTSQDQLSFPVVARRHRVEPTPMAGNAVQNQFFVYRDHEVDE